ncbi:glycosyltransferase [Paracoccus benzoatiresistens]|uniref:Glycosyltransferase n=1 Tax=Paracoccus benzoatiresistens TaxID=2997341 RepID=A0ABT4J0J6_9RHOB|nr:glycosyltransferase [Paracoccus sp. EF6]MCZ0960637.1 glycosyltransferase [Paracoccus sp. EF6]
MKILFIQGGFDAGGAEKIVSMLARHRSEKGDQVTVAGMLMPAKGSYFPYPPDIRLIAFETGRSRYGRSKPLHRLAWLRDLIRREKPDLVISMLTKVNILTLLASIGTGTQVIVSERNNPRMQASRLVRNAQTLMMRRADGIVMQTERIRTALPAHCRSRAVVIVNPCAPIAVERQPQGAGCRMVAVGRLDPQKGYDMLLEAFAKLKPIPEGVTLTIFGEGPSRPALEAQRDALGLADTVSLPGRSAGPADWLGRADLLVVSSRFEGYMNTITEATITGVPVVAFDCDYGPREQIVTDKNGILVPPGDIVALARAMRELALSPQRREALSGWIDHSRWLNDPERILGEWDMLIDRTVRKPVRPRLAAVGRGHQAS